MAPLEQIEAIDECRHEPSPPPHEGACRKCGLCGFLFNDEEMARREDARRQVALLTEQAEDLGLCCQHPGLERPAFNEEAAKGLSAAEVQKRWPRKTAGCVRCGSMVTLYASYAHYIAGD